MSESRERRQSLKAANGSKYIYGPAGPLYQIRREFYGADVPNATPDKEVTITVEEGD